MNGDSNDCCYYSIANESSTTLCSPLGAFCNKLKVLYKISGDKCIY